LCCWVFLAASVPTLSLAAVDGFGRFGYTRVVRVPGLELTAEGVRAIHGNADRLRFAQPLKQWQVVESTNWRQTVLAEGGPGKPSKLRFDLFDCGIGLYFPAGVELRISSTGAPMLTGTEATFGPSVPTPDVDWLAVSFQDQQPPLVLGFPDSRTSMTLTGEPGNWVLRSPKNFKGWVRLALPNGTEPLQTTSAKSLGRLKQRCVEYESLWYGALADVSAPEIEEDAFGLDLTWNSPRKLTVIPNTFYLSGLGGYPVKFQSNYKVFPARTNEGPLVLTEEPRLQVRMPVRRIPIGRGLTVGEPFIHSLKPQAWNDPIGIVNTALENTLCGRSQAQSEQARELLQSFYETHIPEQEPYTKQSVFYKKDGTGLLQTAIHGLLSQSIKTGQPNEETEDPQLISLFWRLDPYSGGLQFDSTDDRRVKAIAAIAGCFSSSVKMRMQSALFQASLSAERGLNLWRRRQGLATSEPRLLEPLFGVRKGLFSLTQMGSLDPVLTNWLSEVRCFGDQPTWIAPSEFGFDLCWLASNRQFGTISVETAYPLNFSSKRNLKSLFSSQRYGYHELRYEPERAGECNANLYIPDWCDPIPITALPPTYQETTQ
jgi:hypothetical protein